MALKSDLLLEMDVIYKNTNGLIIKDSKKDITLSDVYIKVETIQGDKNNILFNTSYICDKGVYHKQFSFSPDMDNENYHKQAYEYLKTLDEFKDAEDV